MLSAINRDKKAVTTLSGQQCVRLWVEAAALCEFTFECPATPGRRLACRNASDLGRAWRQDGGTRNCKRVAFIFHFYGTEVYRRALSTTHQEATAYNIMATLGVVMDVPPAEMRLGQKTCVQQQYSATSNVRKHNILRLGGKQHNVFVNLEQGDSNGEHKNWKRPKAIFFVCRKDASISCNHREKVSGRLPGRCMYLSFVP